MMNKLPVIYYHKGCQDYLSISLKQCLKYNTSVILMGDESNRALSKELNVEWVNASNYEKSDAWERFEKAYKHMSTNPYEFELMCFKRFFVINSYLESRPELKCFMYLDSDIMTYCDYSSLLALNNYEFGMCVKKDQAKFDWTANCGISYFTKKALNELLSFFIDVYENKISLLEEKWNYQKANNLPGGICDMTLEYLYFDNHRDTAINLANPIALKDGVMDCNINSSDNYDSNEFDVDDILGIKKIVYEGDDAYFVKGNEKTRALAIHFNGPAKRYMETYYCNKCCSKEIYKIEKNKRSKEKLKNTIKKLLKK